MDPRILIAVFMGIFLDWLGNFLLLKLLFRPVKPIKIFSLEIQGIIPKRIKEIREATIKVAEETFPWYLKLPIVKSTVLRDLRRNYEEFLTPERIEEFIFSRSREMRIAETRTLPITFALGFLAAYVLSIILPL